ncbi:shikimate kinase [Vitiosangium sp. GDMCC 1.1324]|uniref:shikimate kinase n=1 Tax=Vitiosangium sp. (strain GDMCC 1.1324) TaxID=2138576 RepID=UPI000D3D8F79|nr:shikimate kinase [Vitiosangium sp. GDMCC 1.1324]PTL80770.1 shikimate kinase [Vitiosangium sp. GDMCC 1.1324]
MSVPSAEQRHQIIERILSAVDPRLASALRQELVLPGPGLLPSEGQTVVIGGHRAAGKTRLLPLVSALLGRPGLDLDAELERRSGRSLRDWVAQDTQGFRAAERDMLQVLPRGSVIAVGGGFLSNHPDALESCYTLLVPVSFETYRERLLADTSRPRLRPGVSLEEEIRSVYEQRQVLHARVPTVSLADFLRAFRSLGSQA